LKSKLLFVKFGGPQLTRYLVDLDQILQARRHVKDLKACQFSTRYNVKQASYNSLKSRDPRHASISVESAKCYFHVASRNWCQNDRLGALTEWDHGPICSYICFRDIAPGSRKFRNFDLEYLDKKNEEVRHKGPAT
jgi:hypothetical protein